MKKIIYIGHIISEKGIEPEKSKIQTIIDMPSLKCVKDIQSYFYEWSPIFVNLFIIYQKKHLV